LTTVFLLCSFFSQRSWEKIARVAMPGCKKKAGYAGKKKIISLKLFYLFSFFFEEKNEVDLSIFSIGRNGEKKRNYEKKD
jgi:hypothetical protein